MLKRRLEHGTKKRVVATDDRSRALLAADFFRDAPNQRDIDKAVHRIRRRLDENQSDASGRHGALGFSANVLLVESVRKADIFDAERRKGPADQDFRASIERPAMQYRLAGMHIGEDRRDDGRHAGREHQPAFGFLVDGQSILDNFQVRMIEAGIDEARFARPPEARGVPPYSRSNRAPPPPSEIQR